jgi:hypothetical protein
MSPFVECDELKVALNEQKLITPGDIVAAVELTKLDVSRMTFIDSCRDVDRAPVEQCEDHRLRLVAFLEHNRECKGGRYLNEEIAGFDNTNNQEKPKTPTLYLLHSAE